MLCSAAMPCALDLATDRRILQPFLPGAARIHWTLPGLRSQQQDHQTRSETTLSTRFSTTQKKRHRMLMNHRIHVAIIYPYLFRSCCILFADNRFSEAAVSKPFTQQNQMIFLL